MKAVYGDVNGSIRPVTIGDNCYIGMNTIILAGSQIGNNTVIGANSVVSGDIPENCVAVGSPCKSIYSLEEYHEKRRKAQLREAVDIVHCYIKTFDKMPTREDFFEYFWLFENNLETIPKRFIAQNNLMHGSETATWKNFKEHEILFGDYYEFLEYAINNNNSV